MLLGENSPPLGGLPSGNNLTIAATRLENGLKTIELPAGKVVVAAWFENSEPPAPQMKVMLDPYSVPESVTFSAVATQDGYTPSDYDLNTVVVYALADGSYPEKPEYPIPTISGFSATSLYAGETLTIYGTGLWRTAQVIIESTEEYFETNGGHTATYSYVQLVVPDQTLLDATVIVRDPPGLFGGVEGPQTISVRQSIGTPEFSNNNLALNEVLEITGSNLGGIGNVSIDNTIGEILSTAEGLVTAKWSNPTGPGTLKITSASGTVLFESGIDFSVSGGA